MLSVLLGMLILVRSQGLLLVLEQKTRIGSWSGCRCSMRFDAPVRAV